MFSIVFFLLFGKLSNAQPAQCSNIEVRGALWNGVTVTGVDLTAFTDGVGVEFIGCTNGIAGSCARSDFFCTDSASDLTFGIPVEATGDMVALLGPPTDPLGTAECVANNNQRGVASISADIGELCEQLGYGSFNRLTSTYNLGCRRISYDEVNMDWTTAGVPANGVFQITCSDPITTTPEPTNEICHDGVATNLPDECSGKCNAFSVEVMDFVIANNEICIDYRVERLFSTGKCSKPITEFTLGLCDTDTQDYSKSELDNLISSFQISGQAVDNSLVKGSKTNDLRGIKVMVNVEQELEFTLCLNDAIIPNGFQGFSNNVRFIRGQRRFNCDTDFLAGLPCSQAQVC